MKRVFLFALILVLLSSCAHKFMRGTVAKKTDFNKAIVCLGKNDIKVGDTVKFQRSECSMTNPPSNSRMHAITGVGGRVEHTGQGQYKCELLDIGRGDVIELVNDHFSIVQSRGSFEFDESTQIEVVR